MDGFKILPSDWGKPMPFKRPEHCGVDMPEYIEFAPMPPPGFDHLPLDEVIAFFEDRIARAEKRYGHKRRKRPVLGIELCEATSPFYTPKSSAPMRTLNPRFSARDKRLTVAALRPQREFLRPERLKGDPHHVGLYWFPFPPGVRG